MLAERNPTGAHEIRGCAAKANNKMEGRLRSETEMGTVTRARFAQTKKTQRRQIRRTLSARISHRVCMQYGRCHRCRRQLACIATSSGTRQPWEYASTAPNNLRDEDGRSSPVGACTFVRAFAVVVLAAMPPLVCASAASKYTRLVRTMSPLVRARREMSPVVASEATLV